MSDSVNYKTDDARQSVFAEMQAHFHASSVGRDLPRLSLADNRLNLALGGGVLCRRAHLITASLSASLASGFSLALVAMMLRAKQATGPIIWCGPLRGGQSGQLFGAGLAEMGLRPEQFIFIRDSHPLRRMAACEEALATPGLAAVIHEYGPLYEKADLWQKSARRLQLACERGSATAFMIGTAGAAAGFESAIHISPATHQPYQASGASGASDNALDWRPRWHAAVRHARGGYPAQANLIWDKAQSSFVTPTQDATHPNWQDQPYRLDASLPHHLRWQKSA